MSEDSISPGDPIFDEQSKTLLIPVSKRDISHIQFLEDFVSANGFQEKNEFHITIVGFDAARKIIKNISHLPRVDQEKIFAKIQNSAKNLDWSFVFKNDIYHLKKIYQSKDKGEEVRESIIRMVDVPALPSFYKELVALTGVELNNPPAHITLYAKSTIEENQLAGIGVTSAVDLKTYFVKQITDTDFTQNKFHTIVFPTRPQPDTLIAVLILKELGSELFENVQDIQYEVIPQLPEGQTEKSMAKAGKILIDVGKGIFDHHSKPFPITASNLITLFLGQEKNKALSKFLQLAERDDFFGKGTISDDPLDRTFGLPGVLSALNKDNVDNPKNVFQIMLPILQSIYKEEIRRAFELPKELEEKISQGKAQMFKTKHRGTQLKCIYIETDNTSMAGFLRSHKGGNYDVVALRLSAGHTNILTRANPHLKIDLRSLAVLIRVEEASARGISLNEDTNALSLPTIISEIPMWYYDTATNSLLNGGPNPKDIEATIIDSFVMIKLIEVGLAEKLWSPKA